MHIPDGFVSAPVSLAAAAVAVAGLGVCLAGARRQLDERTAPLAGLVAVFVFAMQMINFPVAAGTSGHLIGGALAAILVGPYAGALAISVVIMVQGLVFADGGLSAMGLNLINMAFIPVLVGWVVFRLLMRVLPARPPAVMAAAFVAGFSSVPVSAAAFVAEYALGGSHVFDLRAVLVAMVGVHVLIGLGEGLITALTVAAVYGVRPDLVYGMRDHAPEGATTRGRGLPLWGFVALGLGLSLLVAGALSVFASKAPDGLERVAADTGFADQAQANANAGFALAEYGQGGGIPVGLAGVIGVGIVVAISSLLFLVVRRRREPEEDVPAHEHGHDAGERLYLHRHTAIHELPAHVKIVTLLAFILMVILTPADQYWAFALYALMLAGVAVVARVPFSVIGPRMLVEVPFVLFAVLMPVLGPEPDVQVLGLSLSQAGLVAAWGILAKGTLGVVGSILLAATTPARDLVSGLQRLRVPSLLVQIAAFMLRYTHVVTDEAARMRIARESRGFEATGVSAWPALAHTGGTLFIRSYERGERVHLAMLSRGYTGSMPTTGSAATVADWGRAVLLPAAALLIAVTAWMAQ